MSEQATAEILKRIKKAKSPYSVPGLNSDCSRGAIKKSYYELSKMVHPDRCKLPEASTYFRIVNSAYTLLHDQETRSKYDSGSKDLWKFGQKMTKQKEIPAIFANGIFTVIDANEDDISPEEIVGVFFADAKSCHSRFKHRRFFSGKRKDHKVEENDDSDSGASESNECNTDISKSASILKSYQSDRFYQSLCYLIPLGISFFLIMKHII